MIESSVAPDRSGRDGCLAAAPSGPAPELLTSEVLAGRTRAGRGESFAVLVERHGPRVFNYLLQLTRHRHDAEDLTQETFCKAFRMLQRQDLDPPRSFVGWLFTIARRTALNHFRAARPTEELSAETEASPGANPAAAAMDRDEQQSLWRLARQLKREQYEALWLRYAEGLSVREITRVMRLNPIHVRVLLHRARQQLARRLATENRREGSNRRPIL